MSQMIMKKAKVRGPRQNLKNTRNGPRPDPALELRPEYRGQPVVALKVPGIGSVLSTTVTTGVIALNSSLSSAAMNTFTTRFAAFSEYRISKVLVKVRNFATSNPGIGVMWFSEDDSSSPTLTKAVNILGKRFNFSNVDQVHTLSYVPHDPAQQTWTLVASGTPVIGYFKLYTDNTNFGSTIVATQQCNVEFDFTVQFRGFI
jgi:hypothetical protein